jgi:hypothetical protein
MYSFSGARYARDPAQVMLVEDQPFPHTLPTNDTAYYNDDNVSTGAGSVKLSVKPSVPLNHCY